MPLFAVLMPANAQTLFAILFKIAAFDMIPAEEFYEDMIIRIDREAS